MKFDIIAIVWSVMIGVPAVALAATGIDDAKRDYEAAERIRRSATTISHLIARLKKFSHGSDTPADIL